MSVGPLKDEFFLAVSKLTVMDNFGYSKEIKSCFCPFLNQWITTILSKGYNPDNFESNNSLKLTFTNIRGLRSNFVECESLLESNSPSIFPLWDKPGWLSIDSGNFSNRGYLPLIRKDSDTLMHGLAVYVKDRLPFRQDFSRKLCGFLLMFSTGFTWLTVLLLFPLSTTFFVFMHGIWFYFI